MVRQKDGFLGERSIVLPPMVVKMEEGDALASSLYVTDIGYYPMARHHHRSRSEAIGQWVLIYCVDGSGWYRLGDRNFAVAKDQYFILPAGLPHEYGAAEGEGWTIYWVHFRGEHAAIYSEGAQEPRNVAVTVTSRISDRINIFEEILATLSAGVGIEDLRYASSLLHHYLASLRYLRQYRNASPRTSASGPAGRAATADVVEAAIHYMRENVERRIALADVVRYVGYSQSHFSALFRHATGYSPLAYSNRLKIEHACRLLATTSLQINQICFKVGFEDSLYFSRLFSKQMGLSPSAWREAASEGTLLL